MEKADEYNQGYWKMGAESFKSFFKELDLTEAKSLQLTKDVIQKRSQLEEALSNIQENMMVELNELQKLDREREVLTKHEIEIDRNKDFTYEVNEQFVEVEPLEGGMTAINCQICYITCLKSRYQWKDSLLKKCWLFDKVPVGCCKCPNQCQYNSHRCEKILYGIITQKVTKTLQGLKREYEEALGKKMTAQQIIIECTERLERVREQTLTFVQQAEGCIYKLYEIALKPESLSTEAYIDLMIEAERARSGEDQARRIQALTQIKEKERLRQRIAQGKGILPEIPHTKRGTRPATTSGSQMADYGAIVPGRLLQMDNMKYEVVVINSEGRPFRGRLKRHSNI